MPTSKPRVTFALSEDQLERLEEYRSGQQIKNQSQAILSLIEMGLSDMEKRDNALTDTPEERKRIEGMVKKYRSLDQYGKEAVEGVLDVEWRRCTQPAPVLEGGLDDMEQLLIRHFPGLPLDIQQRLLEQMQAMKVSQKEELPSSVQE